MTNDTKNEPSVVPAQYIDSTPLALSEINPNDFTAAELCSSVTAVRVTMIQNLTAISNDIYKALTNTTDLHTRLQLSKELQRVYSEINAVASKLEQKSNMSTLVLTKKDAPYLDFEKRKPRARTWDDYSMYCRINYIEPVKKRELFAKLTELNFRLSSTAGEMMLVPPGVRMNSAARRKR